MRSLRQRGRPLGPGRSARDHRARRGQGAVPRERRRLGRRAGQGAAFRHRHRRRHHLSRLQARPLHRRERGPGRRHGDRRLGGHLQLLRPEGEDRHRPLSRPRAGGGARRRRADRPRHDRRIRLADALARRRAPPDRRLQARGQRHLPGAAGALQPRAGRGHGRRRCCGHAAGGCCTDRERRAGGAHAGRLRLGRDRHLREAMVGARRRGDRGRRPHHGRADRAPGRPLSRHGAGRHPRARPPLDARALFSGRRARLGLGRHRRRRPADDHREDRPQGRLAGPAPADGLDHRRGRRRGTCWTSSCGRSRHRCRPRSRRRSSGSPRTASRR